MSNRRLIEMIRGRAKAGDPNTITELAAHPRVTRALTRASIGVGAAGILCVGLSSFGGGLLDAAASAGVSAGGSGGGASRSDGGEVAGLAAGDPVEVGALDPVDVAPDAAPSAMPAVAEAPAEVVTTPVTVAIAAVRQPVVAAPPAAAGSVEAVITEVFGPHAAAAIGVARCESGLRPEAISRGGGNWGLFQINRIHRDRVARMGFQWEQLLDARVNSLVAKTIFDEQGWGPWACRHAAR